MNCLHLHGELSKHIKGTSCRNIFVTELKLKIPSIISHSNFDVKLFWLNYSITMTLFKIFFIIQLGLMIQTMYFKSVKNAYFHKNKWKLFFVFFASAYLFHSVTFHLIFMWLNSNCPPYDYTDPVLKRTHV